VLAQTRPVTLALFTAGEGELVAVKSENGAAAARGPSLSSPHVIPCLGFRCSSSSQLRWLTVDRNKGRLEEPALRANAADVKARNVVSGADDRDMLEEEQAPPLTSGRTAATGTEEGRSLRLQTGRLATGTDEEERNKEPPPQEPRRRPNPKSRPSPQ
jgi:hypothetical protein